METFLGLYRILVAVSAAALLLGLVLIVKNVPQLEKSKKHLFILAIVNFVSMMSFLFNLEKGYESSWSEAIVFINALILLLNMTVGYFVYVSLVKPQESFAQQIKSLFLISFISICIYTITYYISDSQGSLLNQSNSSFIYIYGYSLLLYSFGSLYPAVRSGIDLIKSGIREKKIRFLLVLNGVTNTVGLVFFTLQIPNKETAVISNIVFNLLFSYYIAYYFLSIFFESKQSSTRRKEVKSTEAFSWEELSKHLNYWEELKDYLQDYSPEVIDEVNELDLTSNEKIHLTLKKLNIKAKDIATAMNISVKAVEMNRYRIKKKLD